MKIELLFKSAFSWGVDLSKFLYSMPRDHLMGSDEETYLDKSHRIPGVSPCGKLLSDA